MSAQLALALDIPAPKRARMPLEPIAREAWIEDGHRWLLKRAWGPGPCILWCGVNPSKADGKRDDPTMLREIGFSYRWGFGSLVKVNLYPFISSTQDELREWRRSWVRGGRYQGWPTGKTGYDAWWHNIRVVREQIKHCERYMAAWGNGADADDLEEFLRQAQLNVEDEEFGWVDVPITWHCLGTTTSGAPKHTLARGVHRIPDDAKPVIWREARA